MRSSFTLKKTKKPKKTQKQKNYNFLTGYACFFDTLIGSNAISYLVYYVTVLKQNTKWK